MFKIFFVVALFVFQNDFTFSQQSVTLNNQITVLGSVEINQKADQASFSFSVKGIGETLRQAVEDAEGKTKSLTGKLIQLGIRADNISTSYFLAARIMATKHSFLRAGIIKQ